MLLLCLAAMCVAAGSALGRAAPARAEPYVDGISDQNQAQWSSSFDAFFRRVWIGEPPSHIRYARYVVQWDAGLTGGTELARLEAWQRAAGAAGLTLDVALADYAGPRPSSAQYELALERLLVALRAQGSPPAYVEAWNEPNHASSRIDFRVDAPTAAAYANDAVSLCSSFHCEVLLGDLHDGEAGANSIPRYLPLYVGELSPAARADTLWALHPYASINHRDYRYTTEFTERLPDPGADRLWFTEVGAYLCQPGHPEDEALQDASAQYLIDTLIPEIARTPRGPQLEHVFYYEGERQIPSGPEDCRTAEDTALYGKAAGAVERPRAAAATIFGLAPVLDAAGAIGALAQLTPVL